MYSTSRIPTRLKVMPTFPSTELRDTPTCPYRDKKVHPIRPVICRQTLLLYLGVLAVVWCVNWDLSGLSSKLLFILNLHLLVFSLLNPLLHLHDLLNFLLLLLNIINLLFLLPDLLNFLLHAPQSAPSAQVFVKLHFILLFLQILHGNLSTVHTH